MKIIVLLVVMSTGTWARPEDFRDYRREFVCDTGKPADVAFFLDTSNSIWKPNFRKMLLFVQEVIDFFVVGPDNIQVSASTFGDRVFTHFDLNRYNNKQKILHSIGKIQHIGSQRTRTDHALSHAFKHTFTRRGGARPGVTKVAIVITDGRSHEPGHTRKIAEEARANGIHVFAIGVGHYVDIRELKDIASKPASENMFEVEDYVGLTRIRDLLAIKTCEVTEPPTTTTTTVAPTTPTPTTTPQPRIKFQPTTPTLKQITTTEKTLPLDSVPKIAGDYDYEDTRKGCSPKQPLDIAFVVDEKQGGTALQKKMWNFVTNIIRNLNLDDGDIRVHLIRECAEIPELHLNQYNTQYELMDHFDRIRPKAGRTAGLLRAMTNKLTEDEESTAFDGNDVLPAKRHKIGVYITDGESDDLYATLREAQRAKLDNDIELFAVGITKDVNPVELNALVSCETDDHLYSVPAHSNLSQLVKVMSHRLCELAPL